MLPPSPEAPTSVATPLSAAPLSAAVSSAAPKPAPKPVAVVKPAPKPAPVAPAMTQKARNKALGDAKKSLRAGQFDDADRRATELLKATPTDTEVKTFRDSVRKTRESLTKGKAAFDRHDCVAALRILGPVLDAAPGAQAASRIVNTCQAALPPKEL